MENINILGFTIHIVYDDIGTVKVWEKSGDFIGFEGSEAEWNLIQDDNSVIRQRNETSLALLDNPVSVAAGSFHSFYIFVSRGIRYKDGQELGRMYTSNEDLIFYKRRGSYGQLPPRDLFSPRVWNGIITYALTPSRPSTI